jgi:hypothetical protein
MNPSFKTKAACKFFTLRIASILVCFALMPWANAVSPAPDGGYPGGNTAEGQSALLRVTTGTYNTAVGMFSVLSLTDGNFCTGVGAGTLFANTADQNTATGAGALLSNTTGSDNTANGAFALLSNTEGVHNTATGLQALLSNTTGSENTATGVNALVSNTIGVSNTATGFGALFHNTGGILNTAIGSGALLSNLTGSSNTAVGIGALGSNIGNSNTASGANALTSNTVGANNTAMGLQALLNNTTGSANVALGVNAGAGVMTADNVICIGAVGGADVSNTCYIGNIFGVTSPGGTGVFINSDGQLATATSSQRFKDDIKPMERASETLFALKPVTFHYKKEIDPEARSQFGLVAEEVEKVNRELVVHDKEGKPYSVRYDAVNAMLLNEFLKEHCRVEKLEATIAQQQEQIAALTARLQKVAAQIEMKERTTQIVDNQ